jgi:hypothetical protein
MKRIILACFLLTAAGSFTLVQQASAQSTPITHTTLADFTAKINLMDSYIGAGNMTAAQSTWEDVHKMMLNVLAVSKQSIYSATSPADKDNHVAILQNQQTIYFQIWKMKPDLATNRSAIHSKLVDFGATIY